MTFATLEVSAEDGRPVELLMVSYLTNHWYYTTAEDAIVHDGNTYTPLPIKHDAIESTGDIARSNCTIHVPQDCPVGELFRVQPPSGVVSVTLFVKHVEDAEVKAVWKGRITNVEWSQPWLALQTESLFTSLKRVGLRRKYAVQCPLALYVTGHGQCNVSKAAFKVDYVVTSISGATVNCAAAVGAAVDHFAGGFVTWVHAEKGYLEQRMVKSSDASGNLVLTSQPPGLVVGMTISTYPGCDHLPETCHSKFNNSLNYGGMPYIPTKNPFNGSTLY
jgi:uncharacterized phage protein (TIGR02218 family)